jgi:serine/threonine protein phosphatase PrpC
MPDVSYHCITEKDEFVVLATDGVSTDLHKHLGCCIFVELVIVKSYEDFCYIIVWVSLMNVGMGCTFQW